MRRTEQYKRRIPADIQGVVIDGLRLTQTISLSLKNGMTRAKAEVFTDDLIARARAQVNYRVDEAEAWRLATAICDAHDDLRMRSFQDSRLSYDDQMHLVNPAQWDPKLGIHVT